MISFGAGVNSVAMVILLMAEGWRGPIVFADTGGEHPDTYCYLRYFSRYLADHGQRIIVLEPGSKYHSKQAGIPLEGYCQQQGIIPLLAVRWCSVEWKRDPLERWRKDQGLGPSMIGFTIDESHRPRRPGVGYPLDDRGINRAECVRIIQRAGLAVPRKSGCFFCPGQPLAQWRALYLDHPDLFGRAAALEANASYHHQKHATLDPHGISLVEHKARRWLGQSQMDLDRWMPCICGL